MTLTQAMAIAKDCTRIHRLMGAQALYPYHDWQIVRALATLMEKGTFDGTTRDDVTRERRRYAALNARFMKMARKHGEVINEGVQDDDAAVAGVGSES